MSLRSAFTETSVKVIPFILRFSEQGLIICFFLQGLVLQQKSAYWIKIETLVYPRHKLRMSLKHTLESRRSSGCLVDCLVSFLFAFCIAYWLPGFMPKFKYLNVNKCISSYIWPHFVCPIWSARTRWLHKLYKLVIKYIRADFHS